MKYNFIENIMLKMIILFLSFHLSNNVCTVIQDERWKYMTPWIVGVITALFCVLIDKLTLYEDDENMNELEDKSNVMKYIGEYFYICESYIENRKTPILTIYEYNDNILGQIKWFGRWRKFCFFPNDNTVWDYKCLSELNAFLDEFNKEWKSKKC